MRGGGPDPPPPDPPPPVDPPLFVMSTIATVTPNLRPGYDRKKNRCQIVERAKSVATRSTVMFKTITSLQTEREQTVLHGRTTNCV